MLKKILLGITSIFTVTNVLAQKTIYDYKVKSLNGEEIDFSKYKGKKILLVNVASKCGFTPQYSGLEKLFTEHSDKVVVIGLPCNQFLFQEPGDAKAIGQFCSSQYNVTFPITEKVKVKGRGQAPVYQFLTKKELNGFNSIKPKWNFYKYLIDEKGNLIAVFPSKVEPLSNDILSAIIK